MGLKKSDRIRVAFACPQLCLSVLIIIVGNMIAAIMSSEDSSYFYSRNSDAGQCFVLLHKKSLGGDSLQLSDYTERSSGEVLLAQNTSTGVIDVQAEVKVDLQSADYNLQGSKWMKSEACSLVLEPHVRRSNNSGGAVRHSTVFRHGASGAPVKFDLCEPYGTYSNAAELQKWHNFSDLGAYKAAFEARPTNPFLGFDMDRAGQQTFMVLILVVWTLFKLAGIIAEVIQANIGEIEGGLWLMAGKWVLFTGMPSQLLAPWTSFHVHEDCPQMAVWLSAMPTDMYFVAVLIGICLLVFVYVVAPVLVCIGNKRLVGRLLVFACGVVGFLVFVVMLIDTMWNFPQLPSFPINWYLLFDFSWPEYSLAWTTSWFRLFSFLIFAYETAAQGLLQWFIIKQVKKQEEGGGETTTGGEESDHLPGSTKV